MSNSSWYNAFNHNNNYENDGVTHILLTDFVLTGSYGELKPLLLENSDSEETYFIEGTLLPPISSSLNGKKSRGKYSVTSYVVDFGRGGAQNDGVGFWMVGEDPDVRFRLVYPAAPVYEEYARGVLDLACDKNLLRYYLHTYETEQYLQWADFSLIDCDLGTSRNLLLSTHTRSLSLLKGTIKLNPSVYCSDGMPELPEQCNIYTLNVQTYLEANYFVDFGCDASGKDPEFWVEDCHHTWIKLVTPCHSTYKPDFELTMNQTIRNVQGYNWAAEDEQIWRHVTNFRLTDLAGALHALEITSLHAHFILWGDLVPPTHSSCPVIPIKLYVTTFSLDLGRDADDPNKGVWMGDVLGDWYKLVSPAHPDFRALADPLFHKADKFLELYDALVYQDPDEKISVYDDVLEQYRCAWDIRDVYHHALPKFDLNFIRENADFVLTHLDTNFHLPSCVPLVNSINSLRDEAQSRSKNRTAIEPAAHAVAPSRESQSTGTTSGVKRAAQSAAAPEVTKTRKLSDASNASAVVSAAAAKGSAMNGAVVSSAASALPSSTSTSSSAARGAVASKTATVAAPPVAAAAPVVTKPIKKKQLEPVDTSSPVLSTGKKTAGSATSAASAPPRVASDPEVLQPARSVPTSAAPVPSTTRYGLTPADVPQWALDAARRPAVELEPRYPPAPHLTGDLRVDTRRAPELSVPAPDGAYQICRFCRQKKKMPKCRNERHIDGKEVWYYYSALNPAPPRPVERQDSSGGTSTPRSDNATRSNDPSTRPASREPAAASRPERSAPALLPTATAMTATIASVPAPPVPAVAEATVEAPPAPAPLPAHIISAQEDLDKEAAARKRAMDLELEHKKYNDRRAAASNRTADEGDTYLNSLFSAGPKAGFAKPGAAARLLSSKQPAAAAVPMVGGLVKLGGRTDEPTLRLAQTTRNARGVFADSAGASTTSPRARDVLTWSSYKHDRAAKAPKSALRRTDADASVAATATSAVASGSATAEPGASRGIRWPDLIGEPMHLTKMYDVVPQENVIDPQERPSVCSNGDE